MFKWFVVAVGLLSLQIIASEHDSADGNKPKHPELETSKSEYGIMFACKKEELPQVKEQMDAYFKELGLPPNTISIAQDEAAGTLRYGLNTPEDDTNTLDLKERFAISDDTLEVNTKNGPQKVVVASRKEIMAALMQHGRAFKLFGKNCSVDKLKDHVGMRQSIVAMTRLRKSWVFATGSGTSYNQDLWMPGYVIRPGVSAKEAVFDPFLGQTDRYRMACTRECSMLTAGGIFYHFDKKSPPTLDKLLEIAKNEPFNDTDPTANGTTIVEEGKYLDRQFNVPWNNLIPGDWLYIRNTDEESSNVPGEEGSNTIYLGGDRMKPPIGDTEVNLENKIKTVYQYRAYSKQAPWTPDLYKRVRMDPREPDGLLRDVRDAPKIF